MQFLIYILSYPFLWLISILPFKLFYWFSDCIYFIVYHIIGYRKKVVQHNLIIAFPNKSNQERLEIEKKFYRHLCDMFLEMIKTMTISSKEMEKRFVVTNMELIDEFEKKGKSIILFASHYASWEWLVSINSRMGFKGVGVYKKISNPYFDKLVRRIRAKYKAELVTTNKTIAYIKENEANGILGLYGLASDQSPQLHRAFHWQKFMGIEVPVHTGAEMLAKRYNLNVLFVDVQKVKRGFYQATFIPMAENVSNIPDYELTDAYLKLVEKQINDAPEFYFWTHNRWKHRR